MLLVMSCKNYRSLYEEATLDLTKPSSYFKGDLPRNGSNWIDATHRLTAVFGANASGKTNLLKPLENLAAAILARGDSPIGSPEALEILHDPHKLHLDEPTQFHIQYVANHVRYALDISIDDQGIVSETLDANTVGRWKNVYNRTRDKIYFGQSFGLNKAKKDTFNALIKPWQLTLGTWNLINHSHIYEGALKWWKKIFTIVRDEEDFHFSILRQGHFKEKKAWKEIVDLIALIADTGVNKVSMRDDEISQENLERFRNTAPESIKDSITDEIIHKIFDKKELIFSHSHEQGFFELPESEESVGTMSWFNIALPCLEALANGGLCLIDEIDANLHPLLVRGLLSAFKNPDINLSGAQLLFTSHDLTLLGNHPEPAIDRQEAWIVEKERSFSTLTALEEYKIRVPYNLEKRYLEGHFGGIPWIDLAPMRTAVKRLRDSEFQQLGSSFHE